VQGGVPDVRGLTLRSAEIELTRAGLSVEVERRHHPTVPEGLVISQSPEASTQVVVGTSVTITVSLGPEPADVVLPNFIGRPLDEVRAEMERLGLKLGELRTQVSDYPQQFIRDQEPAPGTTLPPGSEVNLVVSQGNGLEPEASLVTVTLPPEPAAQQVEIRVRDRSERLVYAAEHQAGATIQEVVYWYPPRAEVLVYVNGRLSTRSALPDDEQPDSRREDREERGRDRGA
ncbi:MAG TPA: PASTA domain-containing protein, partial [Bacillota bacterium]